MIVALLAGLAAECWLSSVRDLETLHERLVGDKQLQLETLVKQARLQIAFALENGTSWLSETQREEHLKHRLNAIAVADDASELFVVSTDGEMFAHQAWLDRIGQRVDDLTDRRRRNWKGRNPNSVLSAITWMRAS